MRAAIESGDEDLLLLCVTRLHIFVPLSSTYDSNEDLGVISLILNIAGYKMIPVMI